MVKLCFLKFLSYFYYGCVLCLWKEWKKVFMGTISSQEVLESVSSAIAEEQFVVYYQPQYDHSSGKIIGAEALIRWNSPKYGMISPQDFIPVLEEHELIPKLDTFVFEQVCRFLRHCMDENLPMARISVNVSHIDIANKNFIEQLEIIRKSYGVPAKYIHVEITESTMVEGMQVVLDSVGKFHSLGYVIEMDDFGSGYSSLNVLSDVEFDVIKLDFKFIANAICSGRGGTILSSIVRMAKWLKLPVIAEGVETIQQADFLRSVGCDYVQGYLYSKPITAGEYRRLLHMSNVASLVPKVTMDEVLNLNDLYHLNPVDSLVFNNFAGSAAVVEMCGNDVKVLRVNEKYLQELGMNMSEREALSTSPLAMMNRANRNEYLDALQKAIVSKGEEVCETWRKIDSKSCSIDSVCIRTSIRLIGENGSNYIFYVLARNVSAEKRMFYSVLNDNRYVNKSNRQINNLFWEYTVKTREMRPCFRCMRELGLPPVLQNFPEPAIERGLIPADYADQFRDWHKQIDFGVKEIDGVIPLTENRLPYKVHYTVEFDSMGLPVKAYGSAKLIL